MNEQEIYSSFDEMIGIWLTKNNLPHSEDVFETMKRVIDDLGESWYRDSLGKKWYH